ncbi:MAG: hypothetical protein EOO04_35075 [Chitinophagaceae bacterium]|nr:MAG: hypothetical protein EOO04_35075 [Chitinophagaceae bacterium]
MFLSTLHQPFPINTWRRYWLRGVSFGLFVFLFLFLFKPFRLDFFPTPRLLWTSAVYGLTTGLVIFSGSFILIKVIAPLINESRWTLGKQILWNSFLMVIIALMNVLVTQLMHGIVLPIEWYFTMLEWVFMLGVFPVAIAELITYNHFLRRHLKTAGEVSQWLQRHEFDPKGSSTKEVRPVTAMPQRNAADRSLTEQGSSNEISLDQNNSADQDPPAKTYIPVQLANGSWRRTQRETITMDPKLELTGENQGDKLCLDRSGLIAVQALDNYVNIFWESDGRLQTTMLRNTLTNICLQLKDLTNIYRTHRGWLVNTGKVIKVDGNAQGLKLTVYTVD